MTPKPWRQAVALEKPARSPHMDLEQIRRMKPAQ
jgi:hypothetical protein